MAGVDIDNLGHDDTAARIDPSCATGVKVGFHGCNRLDFDQRIVRKCSTCGSGPMIEPPRVT